MIRHHRMLQRLRHDSTSSQASKIEACSSIVSKVQSFPLSHTSQSFTTIMINFPTRNYRGLWLSSMGDWLAITNTQLSDLCCHSILTFEHFNALIADFNSDADVSSWTGRSSLPVARLFSALPAHQLFLRPATFNSAHNVETIQHASILHVVHPWKKNVQVLMHSWC
jgi:hypothetical protein